MSTPLRGDVPVVTDDDVKAVLPYFMRGTDPAPVKDALIAAIRAMCTTYQDLSAYAATQSDVLTATGPYLDALLSPITKRHVAEEDEDYRARGLGFQAVVTPEAILDAVNAIIYPLRCSYLEPSLDRMFLSDGTPSWRSYVGAAPTYQDRFYMDDLIVNRGTVRAGIDPGLGYLFSDCDGRIFVIRIPDLSGLDVSIQLVYNGTKLNVADPSVPELGGANPPASVTPPGELASTLGGVGIYMYDNATTADSRFFIYNNTTDSFKTYELIVSTVDRLKGASFRWALYVQ